MISCGVHAVPVLLMAGWNICNGTALLMPARNKVSLRRSDYSLKSGSGDVVEVRNGPRAHACGRQHLPRFLDAVGSVVKLHPLCEFTSDSFRDRNCGECSARW